MFFLSSYVYKRLALGKLFVPPLIYMNLGYAVFFQENLLVTVYESWENG